MNPFQFHIYSVFSKKKSSDLEKAFKDLEDKVELYEKQYELTLKLYKSEWTSESKDINEKYAILVKEGKLKYDKAFSEMEDEDDSLRHSYANSVSELVYIEYEHQDQIENLKNKYTDFFDLYSKSILIALYSLIESKLKEICDIASIVLEKELKYEHLDSRDYLNTSINYINLVLQIPSKSLDPFISKLKDIQFIRNRIIHAEAKFLAENKKTIFEIVKKSNDTLELIDNKSFSTLKIKKPKIILDFFELTREFFEEIIWLLDIKQENKILRKGLEFWFGILDKNIFLRNIVLNKVTKSKRNIEFDVSSRKRNIPKFKCKISVEKAKENTLEIIDQLENESINSFTKLVNAEKSILFDYVFDVFNISSRGVKIKVIMF